MTGRDDRHLSMRARNATTRLTEYTATRVRYKPVTYAKEFSHCSFRLECSLGPGAVHTPRRWDRHVTRPETVCFATAKTNSLQFARNLSEYSGEKVPLRVQAPHTPQLAPGGWVGHGNGQH